MASSSSLLMSVLCTCMIMTSSSLEFQISWHQPDPIDSDFYIQWAERERFQIGDSLVFEYQNDSVVVVEKWDYFHCDPNEPIASFDDGNSTITLDRSGLFYFISGNEQHCQNGQKLIVDVMSPHSIPRSLPPSISIAPEGFSSLAPSPLHSSDASTVLGSFFMVYFAIFVIVLLLLAP